MIYLHTYARLIYFVFHHTNDCTYAIHKHVYCTGSQEIPRISITYFNNIATRMLCTQVVTMRILTLLLLVAVQQASLTNTEEAPAAATKKLSSDDNPNANLLIHRVLRQISFPGMLLFPYFLTFQINSCTKLSVYCIIIWSLSVAQFLTILWIF